MKNKDSFSDMREETLYKKDKPGIIEVLGLEFENEDADYNLLYEAYEGTATDSLTGAMTKGGVSEDISQDFIANDVRIGGPTGSEKIIMDEGPSVARGVDKHPTHDVNKELAAKVAADNECALYKF